MFLARTARSAARLALRRQAHGMAQRSSAGKKTPLVALGVAAIVATTATATATAALAAPAKDEKKKPISGGRPVGESSE